MIHDLVAAATGLDTIAAINWWWNAFPFESTLTAEQVVSATQAAGTVKPGDLPPWLQVPWLEKKSDDRGAAGAVGYACADRRRRYDQFLRGGSKPQRLRRTGGCRRSAACEATEDSEYVARA